MPSAVWGCGPTPDDLSEEIGSARGSNGSSVASDTALSFERLETGKTGKEMDLNLGKFIEKGRTNPAPLPVVFRRGLRRSGARLVKLSFFLFCQRHVRFEDLLSPSRQKIPAIHSRPSSEKVQIVQIHRNFTFSPF